MRYSVGHELHVLDNSLILLLSKLIEKAFTDKGYFKDSIFLYWNASTKGKFNVTWRPTPFLPTPTAVSL